MARLRGDDQLGIGCLALPVGRRLGLRHRLGGGRVRHRLFAGGALRALPARGILAASAIAPSGALPPSRGTLATSAIAPSGALAALARRALAARRAVSARLLALL